MDRKHRALIQDANEFIKTMQAFNNENENPFEKTAPPVGNSEPSEEEINETPNLPAISFTNFGWPSPKKDERAEIITYCEQYYQLKGKLPEESDFRLNFPDLTLNEDFYQSLQEPLTARGIPGYKISDDWLQPNFVLAVNLICNVYDKRSIPAKLKAAGLTSSQFRGFLKIKHHEDYYKACVDQIFDKDTKQEAKLQLSKLVAQGDLQAIKHFNEVQNIYRPQSNNQEIIMLYLHSIMEILARHISPDVLNKVAAEIKTIEVTSHEQRAINS